MKRLLLSAAFLLLTVNAFALPIDVKIGDYSTVSVADSTVIGWTDIAVTRATDLQGLEFKLTEDSPSYTFDFFNISIGGLVGVGTAQIQATLDIANPDLEVTDNSVADWGTFFGVITATSLTWNNMPQTFTLSDGHTFKVDFEEFTKIDWSSNFSSSDGGLTVHATVSAFENTLPIPEPATILLLSSGFIGLAGFRKKFRK